MGGVTMRAVSPVAKGRIILLNGTSSAGKTTLAHALRARLPATFCYYASDQLADADFRPLDPEIRFATRAQFFDAFHRSIPAMASAGLDLLIEHIVEEQAWAETLKESLQSFDVFWVGVHADLQTVLARERERGNRTIGEAAFHMRTHSCCRYDLEVNTEAPIDAVVNRIVEHWTVRHQPCD